MHGSRVDGGPQLTGQKPRHPKAPSGVSVELKYGEAHYPESSVPDDYTLADDLGRKCRYILVFLVYNHKGERLQKLSQVGIYSRKHQPLTMYGQLIPIAALSNESKVGQVKAMLRNKRKRDYASMGQLAPYPVFASLEELVFEYGRSPHHCPAMWLKSVAGVYYRLEDPAGRYYKLFSEEKRKFDVSTRFLKTLQLRPLSHVEELLSLLLYGARSPDLVPSVVKAQQVIEQCAQTALSEAGCSAEEMSENTLMGTQHSNDPGGVCDSEFAKAYAHLSECQGPGTRNVTQELTPWGEQYRIFPPVARDRIIHECGRFVIEQAIIFGKNCGSEAIFSKLPAILQLGDLFTQLQLRLGTSVDFPLKEEPHSTSFSAEEPVGSSNGSLTNTGGLCLAPQPPPFPRYWMKTALHVFDPKPLPHFWEQPVALRKPFFAGHDWLWSPQVVTGKPVASSSNSAELEGIEPLPLQPPIITSALVPESVIHPAAPPPQMMSASPSLLNCAQPMPPNSMVMKLEEEPADFHSPPEMCPLPGGLRMRQCVGETETSSTEDDDNDNEDEKAKRQGRV